MIQAGAPLSLWGEAMQYAAYILNHVTRKFDDGPPQTRMERWSGRPEPPVWKKLRVFGCASYVQSTAQHPDKFAPSSNKLVLLGFDPNRNCYRLATIPNYKLVFSIHVTFNESDFPMQSTKTQANSDQYLQLAPVPRSQEPVTSPESVDSTTPNSEDTKTATRPVRIRNPSLLQLEAIQNTPETVSSATEIRFSPKHFLEDAPSPSLALASTFVEFVFSTTSTDAPPDPKNHSEAMRRHDAAAWRQAEIDEFLAHEENNTFGPPTRPPPHANIVPTAMV